MVRCSVEKPAVAKKGTKNKAVRGTDVRYLPKELAIKIAKLDQTGGLSMAEIQVNAARWMSDHAKTQRILGNLEAAARYDSMASKIAHDVAPYIYATQAAVKHSGDEDAPPIRIESLSDQQLEKLIERLRRS